MQRYLWQINLWKSINVRQTKLAPVCISLNIDTTGLHVGQGPWESHMGIPGEDRWAGRRFPCIQVLQPPVHMGCDAQCTCALLYTRYPTHSCGGSTACVTTIQLHPLTLDCFCCSLAKAHLSMPATEERQLTINQFFGFLLLGDRLHRYIQYGRGANTQ